MGSISVVMPHYNSGIDVRRAYNSILNQTLLPQEIIIIDDYSFDKSVLIELEACHKNVDVYLRVIYLEVNGGPSIARNIGVKKSKCEYIAFLDSDDVWSPDKLLIQYNMMMEHDIKFSFHGYLPQYSGILSNERNVKIKKISLLSLAKKQIICTPTVMIKKDFLCEFDSNLRYCEDFLCWVMSNNDYYFYYIDLNLASGFKDQYGAAGLSANMKKMHLGFLHCCKILYENNFFNLFLYIVFVFFEYIKYPVRLAKVYFRRNH